MVSDSLAQIGGFSEEEQRGLYRAIYSRRDIRTFRSDPIPSDMLARIIRAAHHGPSVGFMQPWDFIMVRDLAIRQRVKDLFDRERQAASSFFDEPRRTHYLSLKLEGILESPINVCVTCDPTRAEVVLGRNSIQETDLYSTCCAVQNIIPVAYLCMGYPVEFPADPVLQTAGWRDRLGLEGLMHFDRWEESSKGTEWQEFMTALTTNEERRLKRSE